MIRRLVIAFAVAFALAMLRSTVHAAPPGDAPVYVVRQGDTLSNIAMRNGTTVAALMAANGIKNQDLVMAGQKLVLPGRAAAAPAASAAPKPAARPAAKPVTAPVREAARPVEATQPAPAKPSDSASVVTGGAPPANAPTTGRWIHVALGKQRLTAYDGTTPVYSTLISSGLARTPTLTGSFKVYTKIRSQRMSGPGYSLPNVPHVMYFIGGYAIHGAYWHNNFGRPMSHGCVNVPLPSAKWLYEWASVGTPVVVTR